MTGNPPDQNNPPRNRDDNWAAPIDRLKVSEVPTGATNINVEGREVDSPMQGFGPLWQKTYRLRLAGLAKTPAEIMSVWKENFPKFQPPENQFYPPMVG